MSSKHTMSQTDFLQRFLFERYSIRGELVFLRESFRTISSQRAYPAQVQSVLGEALAAAALLSATIKYQGSLILQVQGSGSVSLLVVQCDEHFNIRGLARWRDDALFSQTVFGDGQLVITVSSDQKNERYQGVVHLKSDELKHNLESYFEQSEQLPTKLWFAVDNDQAVGLLIQKMPNTHQGEQEAGSEWDYWEHISALSETITQKELLSLDSTEILYRLFHEEDVRIFGAKEVQFRCGCNHDKMIQALKVMGKPEIDEILKTHRTVDVTCEFCNRFYEFDQHEIARIFG